MEFPVRRLRLAGGAHGSLPIRVHASLGVVEPLEFCVSLVASVWVRVATELLPVSEWSPAMAIDRSPGTSRVRFILLRLFSLSEFLRRPPAPGRGSEHYLPGFLPSSRYHRKRPHFARFPGLASFRPRVFSTSRRLAPLPALRACFVPQPRPGFSRWGLIPIFSARRLVAAAAPLPFRSIRSPTFADVRGRIRRLRGFVPKIDRVPSVRFCSFRWSLPFRVSSSRFSPSLP